ncbi:MAG: TolB family protein, partial [Actinomycetota bacterium]
APDGTWDLYILPSGDASHLATLTDTTSPDELWPQLSPDHTQLAYAVPQPDGSDQVWILRLGADWRVLSRTRIPLDRSATPEAWTPDGRLVVQLGSASAPVLAYVDLLTGRTTRFLSGASTLSFSPDGRRITFARRHGDGGWAIWVADADGSHAHVVADTPGTDEFPFFSPDGGTIAFTSDVSGSQDVWTVPAAGGDLCDITPHTEGSRDLSFGWSPDGHVLLLSDRSHTGGTFLYFMNADGSDVQLALRI